MVNGLRPIEVSNFEDVNKEDVTLQTDGTYIVNTCGLTKQLAKDKFRRMEDRNIVHFNNNPKFKEKEDNYKVGAMGEAIFEKLCAVKNVKLSSPESVYNTNSTEKDEYLVFDSHTGEFVQVQIKTRTKGSGELCLQPYMFEEEKIFVLLSYDETIKGCELGHIKGWITSSKIKSVIKEQRLMPRSIQNTLIYYIPSKYLESMEMFKNIYGER